MKEKFSELNPNAKVTIVLVSIIVIFAIILFIFSPKSNHKRYSYKDFDKVVSKSLNDMDIYLTVENNINKYLMIDGDNATYGLLDELFIKENDVHESNALKKSGKEGLNLALNLRKVYELTIDEVKVYYASGILYNQVINDDEYTDVPDSFEIKDKNYGILVFIDYNNLSYSVYPNINQNEAIDVLNSKSNFNIELNDYNKLMKTDSATKLNACKKYYSDLLFRINHMPDELYEKLDTIDKNNFKNKKEFKEYLDKYYKDYEYSFISCDEGNSSKILYLNDKEGTFKIKISGLMDYTVDLP